MKAYQVDGPDYSLIVFNRTLVLARFEGADSMGKRYNEVSCKRSPEYDIYYPLRQTNNLIIKR